MTNNSSGSNGTNAAAGGWLGFSLSPHMASAMDDHHHHHHHVQQQQQQHHNQGLFFPASITAAAAAAAYGALGAGDAVATSVPSYYTPQLASMPLKSDGSLCIMEALRRSDQDHHGPKLEDFLGAAQPQQAMALSLDNAASSFYYYGGVGGGHHNQQQHHGFLQQPCADLYGGPSAAALVADEEAAAAATAMARWVAARAESGGGVLSAAGWPQRQGTRMEKRQ